MEILGLVSFLPVPPPERSSNPDAGAKPRLGVAVGERILDCTWAQTHIDHQLPSTMDAYLAGADPAWPHLETLVHALEPESRGWLKTSEVCLCAPLPRPGKILAVGLNYREHIEEQQGKAPEDPLIFVKLPTAVIGPGEAIKLPQDKHHIDYEGELGVVLGRGGRHWTLEEAQAAVAGYTIVNDVTARDLQRRDRQWTRAKGFDTFCPMGPYLVPVQRCPQAHRLTLETRVNGELRQQASTAQMIHSIPELLVYISSFCTLETGDLLLTGTPSGVGAYREPPCFLQAGDEVAITLEGLGTLVNPVV